MVGEGGRADNNSVECRWGRSRLAEFDKHSVDRVEGRVDLFSDLRRPTRVTRSVKASYVVGSCPSASNNYLCTREDNLARDKDEQDDLGLDHTVDEAGEQLRVHD